MKLNRLLAVALIAGLAGAPLGASAIAQSADRHVGYYYPAPATSEIYDARVPVLPGRTGTRAS